MAKNNFATKHDNTYSHEELDNLSNNVLKKMAQLSVSLPELAKLMEMEYQTLWRITYQKDNYVPNLRALYPIADFFHVTIADLLKNPNMPQYIPLLDLNSIEGYLTTGKSTNYKQNQCIFSSEYIHEKAFAICLKSYHLESMPPIIYICKPYNNIKTGNYLLVKNEKRIHLVRANLVESGKIECIDIENGHSLNFITDNITVLSVAVKQLVDNDLL